MASVRCLTSLAILKDGFRFEPKGLEKSQLLTLDGLDFDGEDEEKSSAS